MDELEVRLIPPVRLIPCLDQRSTQTAAGSSEALEALAHTRVIVTLSTSAALETVVISKDMFHDISSGVQHVNTLQKRSASRRACVVLHHQKVLLALVAVASEGDVHGNDIVGQIEEVTVHMDTINDAIGQVQKSRLNVGRHGGGAVRVDLDGGSGEGLIQTRLEGQSEGSASLSRSGGKGDSLSLVLNIVQLVRATIHPRLRTEGRRHSHGPSRCRIHSN